MVIASPLCGKKPFSKGKYCVTVQNSEEFADAVSRFAPSTKFVYINQSTIDEKINSKNVIFSKSSKMAVRVSGITKGHMIHYTSHSAKLWRKCGYQLDQPDTTVHFNPRASTSLETKDESAIENDAVDEITDFDLGD